MFRLIKLAIYALIGYALYEFFRGLSTTAPGGAGAQNRQGGQRGQSQGEYARSGSTQFSGRGQGRREQSEEPSGEAVPHMVGRGVVQR